MGCGGGGGALHHRERVARCVRSLHACTLLGLCAVISASALAASFSRVALPLLRDRILLKPELYVLVFVHHVFVHILLIDE